MAKFQFELSESGDGPAMLMLPGSYATPAAWKGILGNLTRSFRLFSTSLPGYGSTPEVRSAGNSHIDLMTEFVGQVVDRVTDKVGQPIHVVGHSWGAHLALAASLRRRIAPRSLLCFEANPIFAQPVEGPFQWRLDVEEMTDRFEAALTEGDPAAAAIIIDFYSRPGTFDEMPDAVRDYCRATAPTNLLDWRSAATFTPVFSEFAQLQIPATLVRGSKTPQPIVDVTAQLQTHLPDAQTEVVEGADHFLISTHAAECAQIVEAHIQRAARTDQP